MDYFFIFISSSVAFMTILFLSGLNCKKQYFKVRTGKGKNNSVTMKIHMIYGITKKFSGRRHRA